MQSVATVNTRPCLEEMVRASVVVGFDAIRKQMRRGTAVYDGSAGRVYAESRTTLCAVIALLA